MPGAAARPSEEPITPERFDGVAFDLDGVLTKTALIHDAAWKRIFDEYMERQAKLDRQPFVPFSSSDYRQYVDGRPRTDGIRAFLGARGFVLPEGDMGDAPERDTIQGLGRRKNTVFLDFPAGHDRQ